MPSPRPLSLPAVPPGDAVIRLDAVTKAFPLPDGTRLQALHPTTLHIARGEVVALVGRSGAGKSTLLRLMNLLERPDAGQVWVAGQELTALGKPGLREARRHIGMIFQQFNLLRNATVFDNVAFPLRIAGERDTRRLAARVLDCLEQVGIADKRSSHPAQLSGGQQQRVAIARAIAARPHVLLCDEPTSALDAETTEELVATLRDIQRTLGVTVVVVTHELPVVTALCDRVVVVEHGRVAEDFRIADRAYRPVTRLGRSITGHPDGPAASPAPPSHEEALHV